MLNDLYFKTACNIRPHFLGPMSGLKIEGPLYYIIAKIHPVILLSVCAVAYLYYM